MFYALKKSAKEKLIASKQQLMAVSTGVGIAVAVPLLAFAEDTSTGGVATTMILFKAILCRLFLKLLQLLLVFLAFFSFGNSDCVSSRV